MEMHQLRYFVAVAELLSFTKAAERNRVSQPSLSQQIHKLERELGQALFDRIGRRVRLTDAGLAFYDRATMILDAVEDARACVEQDGDWQRGTVSIGAIHTIAPYLLPDVVERFTRRFPHAHLVVAERLTEELVAECLAGDLDVGIVALPIDERRLQTERLFAEKLLAALPAGSPLARRRSVPLAELTRQPFVLLDDMHCLGRQTLQLCSQRDCTPAVSCRAAQLLTIQELVANRQGVSLLPEMATTTDRDARRTYRPLAGPPLEREVAAMWRPRYRPKKLVEAVREMLRDLGRERFGGGRTRPRTAKSSR